MSNALTIMKYVVNNIYKENIKKSGLNMVKVTKEFSWKFGNDICIFI